MSDATLLSILLFALYESITSSEHSVSAWARHIEGAVAIVKARGVKQFDDPQSLLLFRAVRTQMLTNAVQQRRAVDNFPGPKGWLSDLPDDESGALTVLEFSIALPNLLSAVCLKTFSASPKSWSFVGGTPKAHCAPAQSANKLSCRNVNLDISPLKSFGALPLVLEFR